MAKPSGGVFGLIEAVSAARPQLGVNLGFDLREWVPAYDTPELLTGFSGDHLIPPVRSGGPQPRIRKVSWSGGCVC